MRTGRCCSASTARPGKTAEELELYLERLEEARGATIAGWARSWTSLAWSLTCWAAGLVLWHPKGGMMRHVAEEFAKTSISRLGMTWCIRRTSAGRQLWETSGHLDFYQESMYAPMDVDGLEYYVKPMNCPFHILIYKSRTPQLSRAAAALCRVGHGISLRATGACCMG